MTCRSDADEVKPWLDTVIRNTEQEGESVSETLAAGQQGNASTQVSEAVTGDSVTSKGRVYVSGPMTGYPDENFPAFNEATDRLRAQGWTVENPAEKGLIDGWMWADYLRYDMQTMSGCTHIYTLPGWQESPGANLEMIVAKALGLEWLNPDGYEPSIEPLIERVPELACLSGENAALATGEVRKVSSTGGEKGVKPERYDLLPWDAVNEVARVYAFGARKYDDHNWRKGYQWSSSIAAAFRHMAAFAMGEDRDPESGYLHPAHAVFHMLSLIAWCLDSAQRYAEHDDRYIIP